MYKLEDAVEAANKLGIFFDNYSILDFLTGLNIESEHGSVNEKTNVTNDELVSTAKIALAHLNEFPNYYNSEYGLGKFEEFLKENKCK